MSANDGPRDGILFFDAWRARTPEDYGPREEEAIHAELKPTPCQRCGLRWSQHPTSTCPWVSAGMCPNCAVRISGPGGGLCPECQTEVNEYLEEVPEDEP